MMKDRQCANCPRKIYRDSKTGLCKVCYRGSQNVAAQANVRRCHTCPTPVGRSNKSGYCQACQRKRTHDAKPSERVSSDRARMKATTELSSLRVKYKEALSTIERQEQELGTAGVLNEGLDTYRIEPNESEGTAEGTVVMVASDWHIEENVSSGTVSGLNFFNLDIAKERATRFFQSGLRLIRLLQQDIKINTVVLALLGDYITNDIHHGEQAETNEVAPVHALALAQNHIISGIEFLLEHSKLSFVIPCHSGNHARTTAKIRWGLENGHSFEYLMYLHLQAYFRNEPRISFIIPEGYHSYVQVYDKTIRFHHGHALRYAGGIGGLFIPTFKAISQWNKARHADIDVFGHFHQTKDGGNFMCNGSLIGYNAFALSIKADYEPPMQSLFLIDKKRGRTCTWPILVGQETDFRS